MNLHGKSSNQGLISSRFSCRFGLPCAYKYSMSSKTIRWGIVSTGVIANAFAEALQTARTGEVSAVASRSATAAAAFAARYGISQTHDAYDKLFADPEIDAVYIATPHPFHHKLAIQAAQAGKHVLCEKPIGIHAREAEEIFSAANAAGVICMEAFMYRCHPQTRKLVELLRSGVLGELRLLEASFGFRRPFDPAHRLFAPELGGGAVLDVGCYPVSLARLAAGVAGGKSIAEPVKVEAQAQFCSTGVDELATATMTFENNVIAKLATAIQVPLDNTVRLFGTEAWLEIPAPWLPSAQGGSTELWIHRKNTAPEIVPVESDRWIYAHEADVFAEAIASGQIEPPAMTPEDSLGNMQALDHWRDVIGLRYPADE